MTYIWLMFSRDNLFYMWIAIALFSCSDRSEIIYTVDVKTPVFASAEEIRSSFEIIDPEPLELLGQMQKIGNLLFVVEEYKGFHVIDYSDPSLPKPVSFVHLLGNIELTEEKNRLFANAGPDLLIFEVIDNKLQLFGQIKNAFAEAALGDGNFIVGYDVVPTEVSEMRWSAYFFHEEGFTGQTLAPETIENKFIVHDDVVSVIGNRKVEHYNISSGGVLQFGTESQHKFFSDLVAIFKLDSFILIKEKFSAQLFQWSNQTKTSFDHINHSPYTICSKFLKQNEFIYSVVTDQELCRNVSNFITVVFAPKTIEIKTVSSVRLDHSILDFALSHNDLFVAQGINGFKAFGVAQLNSLKLEEWGQFSEKANSLLTDRSNLFVCGEDGIFFFEVGNKSLTRRSHITIE